MQDRLDCDVVVVGAGLAGLATALRASELGCRAVVLEKGDDEAYLCNSRYTGGVFHIAMDNILGERDWVLQNLYTATYNEAPRAMAEALVDTAPRAMAWLRGQGVKFARGGPSGLLQNQLAPFGLRQTGLNPGGRPYWVGRSGDVMLRTLADRLRERGGEIRRGHRARKLIVENGRCVGVEVETARGGLRVNARAVALCDGGFQANVELLRRFVSRRPERLKQRNAGTGAGDALQMAEAVGAKTVGENAFYGHLLYRDAMEDDRFWPYPMLDFIAHAGIVVDGSGRRFCDEGRGGIFIANMIARLDDPLSAVMVFDAGIWDGPARDFVLPANPHFLTAGGKLIEASTLKDLAKAIDVDPAALEESVAEHNRFATGESTSPGAIPRTTRQYKAWPIARAPFLAIPVCAGVTYTMGGVATDPDGRVLSKQDAPIPGLFAAGACTGGLEGWTACGYSGGLSKASIFGMRAAEAISAELKSA